MYRYGTGSHIHVYMFSVNPGKGEAGQSDLFFLCVFPLGQELLVLIAYSFVMSEDVVLVVALRYWGILSVLWYCAFGQS